MRRENPKKQNKAKFLTPLYSPLSLRGDEGGLLALVSGDKRSCYEKL